MPTVIRLARPVVEEKDKCPCGKLVEVCSFESCNERTHDCECCSMFFPLDELEQRPCCKLICETCIVKHDEECDDYEKDRWYCDVPGHENEPLTWTKRLGWDCELCTHEDNECDECNNRKDCCECDEDDEWIEVYDEPKPFPIDMPVQDDIGTTTFQGYTYYNCWGGGPEGGYLTCDRGVVIKINRTWGEPFKVIERLGNFKIVYREQDAMKGICRAIKIVGL